MTCQLCEQDSGSYHMNNECCQMRFIANMPRFRRQQYYQQKKRELGEAGANQIIEKVNGILQRRRAGQLAKTGEK